MKLSKNAITILEKRYLLKDENNKIIETPEQMIDRVVNHVCDSDELKSKAKELMLSLKFLPNTPTLMNSGSNRTLSACYVLPIQDSLKNILETLKWQSHIHKAGGGVGINFSNLRPVGDTIKTTGGVTSGVLSFIKNFDTMSGSIHQGGKRDGANMTILSCYHPQIEDFITIKTKNNKDYENMNFSVLIDDNFMKAVIEDKEISLSFPIKSNNVRKKVKAKYLFDLICESAWKCGCPGILFENAINRTNILKEYLYLDCTNPCVVGSTKILTKNGYIPIKDLVEHEIEIWNGFEWSKVTPRITAENQPIIDIYFSDGSELSCTPYHKFILNDLSIVKADYLNVGNKLIKWNLPIIEGKESINTKIAYTVGFFSGDGSKEKNRNKNAIWLYNEKKKLLKYLHYDYVNECVDNNENNDGIRLYVKLHDKIKYEKDFVPTIEWDIKSRLYWLAGLLDSDGSLNDKMGSVNITSINKEFLLNTKLMLNTLGINPTVAKTHTDRVKNIKGILYNCKSVYRLLLSASDIVKLKNVGLETFRIPLIANPARISKYFVYVKHINRHYSIEDKVYCFNEPLMHTGIFNGVITSQCGEQVLFCGKVPSNIFVDEHSKFDMALNAGEPIAESCNLGSLNLSAFIEDNTGIFKFKELEDAIITSVEFLDCVIDVNTYQFGDEKFEFIEKGTKLTRKIGLGITGFHEMLVKMGISYGSKESIEWAEKVMSFINEKSNEASIKLAERKGIYPLAHLVNDKRRNATTTTIAPTGTIGRFMLGYGHALGIEPPFALYIESKIIESTLNEGVYPPLVKVLQEQCNKKLFDEIIEKTKQNGKSIQNIEEIPIKIRELFRTADEIPIEQHIAIQAAFQRHTQNAVSKTINLDNGTTIAEVHKAFLMAYNNGLKGITIYRNGSKDAQVLNVPQNLSELTKKAPTPRPRYKDHIAIIREIESACGVTYCGISFDKYGLFEVFPINSGKGGCIASQEAIGRSGSTMLRFNVPVETIIKQFGRVKCNSCLTKDEFYDKNNKFIGIKSCSHGLSKQMNDYYSNPQLINDLIKLQTKIHEIFNHNGVNDNLTNDFREIKIINKDNDKYCPDCKIPLIRQEGCSSEGCPNCGRGGCS